MKFTWYVLSQSRSVTTEVTSKEVQVYAHRYRSGNIGTVTGPVRLTGLVTFIYNIYVTGSIVLIGPIKLIGPIELRKVPDWSKSYRPIFGCGSPRVCAVTAGSV